MAKSELAKVGRKFERTPEEKWKLLNTVWMWMHEGFSFRGSCGAEGLSPASVMRWMSEIPKLLPDLTEDERSELQNVIKDHHDAAHAAREHRLQQRLFNSATGAVVTANIFALKCSAGGPEEWREGASMLVDMTDDEGTTRVTLNFEPQQETEGVDE